MNWMHRLKQERVFPTQTAIQITRVEDHPPTMTEEVQEHKFLPRCSNSALLHLRVLPLVRRLLILELLKWVGLLILECQTSLVEQDILYILQEELSREECQRSQ